MAGTREASGPAHDSATLTRALHGIAETEIAASDENGRLDRTALIDEIARALDERDRLRAESRQRLVELEIVNEVGRALARQLDFGAIVEAVGDRTAAAWACAGCRSRSSIR